MPQIDSKLQIFSLLDELVSLGVSRYPEAQRLLGMGTQEGR